MNITEIERKQRKTMETELLTTEEAAEFLRTTTRTLLGFRQLSKGPSYSKVGSKILYKKDDLLKFIDLNKVETKG